MDTGVGYWFVGAKWRSGDQTSRFLREGIWESEGNSKHEVQVRALRPGDRIAIKATYTQKKNLPFANKNRKTASVMMIKARGTVLDNPGDGRSVSVLWDADVQERKWYFFTYRSTITKSVPNRWMSKALLDFTFEDQPQDYQRFCNHPYWRERFGDSDQPQRFQWTAFYEEIANKLLHYRHNRPALVDKLHEIAAGESALNHLIDMDADDREFPLADVCPFTVLGTFNRQISDVNRRSIAKGLAEFLEIDIPVPTSFEGIPVLNNYKSWFFSYSHERGEDDIERLWQVFESAIRYVGEEGEDLATEFSDAYDAASDIHGVGWNLSIGLYWIRPWAFIPLDTNTQAYVTQKLDTRIGKNGQQRRCSALDYLTLIDTVETRFKEEVFPVHSFPELSLAAHCYQPSKRAGGSWKSTVLAMVRTLCEETGCADFSKTQFETRFLADLEELYPVNSTVTFSIGRALQILRDDGHVVFLKRGEYRWNGFEHPDEITSIEVKPLFTADAYGVQDILTEGCFLSLEDLEKIQTTLQRKKNIVLQGPPGTGKTWLAKKLAFALIGYRQEECLRAVQFHPNLSYEDFIRGWRPTGGEAGLQLVDGPFLEMVNVARNDPQRNYVVVIEEVNRGNPAQIFGEMLTLLEADKRTPDEALELSYGTEQNKRVYIPDNLYVIGTMNIADRSLALVDLALRRRFAFIDLKPQLNERWASWLSETFSMPTELVADIQKRMRSLNKKIRKDPMLGVQFQVGHSYVTPTLRDNREDLNEAWFRDVVEVEIYPLLQEYYFENPKQAADLCDDLLRDWPTSSAKQGS